MDGKITYKKGFSITYQNQLVNAIKIFYTKYKKNHLEFSELQRPLKSNTLPEVLSLNEVTTIILI